MTEPLPSETDITYLKLTYHLPFHVFRFLSWLISSNDKNYGENSSPPYTSWVFDIDGTFVPLNTVRWNDLVTTEMPDELIDYLNNHYLDSMRNRTVTIATANPTYDDDTLKTFGGIILSTLGITDNNSTRDDIHILPRLSEILKIQGGLGLVISLFSKYIVAFEYLLSSLGIKELNLNIESIPRNERCRARIIHVGDGFDDKILFMCRSFYLRIIYLNLEEHVYIQAHNPPMNIFKKVLTLVRWILIAEELERKKPKYI